MKSINQNTPIYYIVSIKLLLNKADILKDKNNIAFI